MHMYVDVICVQAYSLFYCIITQYPKAFNALTQNETHSTLTKVFG